ncbi:hypothetical protein [Vibrio phage XM1]|nr:hypothetical protein [Vibrio phage XM1]
MNIKKSIRRLMAEKDITQKQIAESILVSDAFISGVVTGAKRISLQKVKAICDAWDVKVSEFISWGEQ